MATAKHAQHPGDLPNGGVSDSQGQALHKRVHEHLAREPGRDDGDLAGEREVNPKGAVEPMHKHSIRETDSWRGFLYVGKLQFSMEVSRRWRSGLIATCGYGGQEDFAEWTFAIPGLFFFHFAFNTPFKWHRIRPFDGKYGESERKIGLYQVAGMLYLLVGHDSMGSHYGTHGRFGPLGRAWRELRRNQQIVLFRGDWILGRAQYTNEVLEEGIPVIVTVGQWEGDSYQGTAKRERRTWKRRFKTVVRDDYQVDMDQGIPFPGKGENSWDCGDDAYFGFGGETIEAAVEHIVKDAILARSKYGGASWRPELKLERAR